MPNLDEPSPQAIDLAAVLHALSDPTRLAVVRQIQLSGERLCGAFEVDVAKSTLSQHFKALREAGLIRSERRGSEMHNTSRHPELEYRFPGLIKAILRSSER